MCNVLSERARKQSSWLQTTLNSSPFSYISASFLLRLWAEREMWGTKKGANLRSSCCHWSGRQAPKQQDRTHKEHANNHQNKLETELWPNDTSAISAADMQSTVCSVSMELNWGITSRKQKEKHVTWSFAPPCFTMSFNTNILTPSTCCIKEKVSKNYKYLIKTASKERTIKKRKLIKQE